MSFEKIKGMGRVKKGVGVGKENPKNVFELAQN